MSLGAAVTFSNGSNLIAQFGPHGLIPHLWAIWEFLLQGSDVVVIGPTPDAVSQVIGFLRSFSTYTPLTSDGDCSLLFSADSSGWIQRLSCETIPYETKCRSLCHQLCCEEAQTGSPYLCPVIETLDPTVYQ